jgi:riboflavin kinase/FMN adenylyltransferase
MLTASSAGELPASTGAGLTIGNFDGVHKGHQALIARTLAGCRERNLDCVLVTFRPHPRCVVVPQKPHAPLNSRERRMELLADLGVERVLELPFTRAMAALTPEEFVNACLLPLNMRCLTVGHDFSLGRDRVGTVDVLRKIGESCSFAVEQVDPVIEDGEAVSSTRLRKMIANGDVRHAARLLGRFHGFSGEVAHGEGRGGKLGFPTANLLPPGVLLPAFGVYATRMRVGERLLRAVTNVGVKPTFGSADVTIESFLPDISENLYGHSVFLEFVDRLREERRFDSARELTRQIDADVAKACEILEEI